MSDIQIFNNPQFGTIRTAGTADKPTFCLSDVCKALDLQAKHVMERLDKGVVSTDTLQTNGGMQVFNFVNEDGLYDVILDSRKPEAKAFRKWVTSEVLPSIRKHGAYATPATIDSILADPDNAIKLLQTLKEERQQRKLAESKVSRLENITREQAPKVLFADAITGTQTNILIRDLAKLIQQNGYNIGEKRLYQWLRSNGYLTTSNRPMQRYVEQGLFFIKEGSHSQDGVLTSHFTTTVTGKGQQYFINKFLNYGNKMV